MKALDEPVVIGFPLRGEWAVPNTPGTRVPSHGTDLLGTRYAYDFLITDRGRKGNPCYSVSFLRYLMTGVPVSKCYCYGHVVCAPCDGMVIETENEWPERKRAFLLSDFCRARANSKFNSAVDNPKNLTGNFIIIKYCDGIYAAFCHLQPGSVTVSAGQTVRKGEVLGKIGHSGNSMFPHLHFQLMDSPDMTAANGLPCAFEQYELFKNGKWENVYGSIPKAEDRIRFTAE